MKIAAIGDEPAAGAEISLCLEFQWPCVSVASAAEGKKGLELVQRESPALILKV